MSDSSFKISWDDFSVMTNKFLDRIHDRNVSLAALEGAKKAWALHYLNLDMDSSPLARVNGPFTFNFVMQEYLIRTTQ